MEQAKEDVKDFWEEASCGEELYLGGKERQDFEDQARTRYQLEPYILDFSGHKATSGKKVLEVGVGLGADHQLFAEAGAELTGVDLTQRAIENTQQRFKLFGLQSKLQVADAEQLPFDNESFDHVYSWGVLHHSPNTPKAIDEVHRVLKVGGTARIMVYHHYSFVGYMLWIRYALLKLRPFTGLKKIYSEFLESPGTKAYTYSEAKELCKEFSKVDVDTVLTHGDLLTSQAGQRHQGAMLTIARLIWPRWFIRTFFKKHGLFMLISLEK